MNEEEFDKRLERVWATMERIRNVAHEETKKIQTKVYNAFVQISNDCRQTTNHIQKTAMAEIESLQQEMMSALQKHIDQSEGIRKEQWRDPTYQVVKEVENAEEALQLEQFKYVREAERFEIEYFLVNKGRNVTIHYDKLNNNRHEKYDIQIKGLYIVLSTLGHRTLVLSAFNTETENKEDFFFSRIMVFREDRVVAVPEELENKTEEVDNKILFKVLEEIRDAKKMSDIPYFKTMEPRIEYLLKRKGKKISMVYQEVNGTFPNYIVTLVGVFCVQLNGGCAIAVRCITEEGTAKMRDFFFQSILMLDTYNYK